MHGMGIYIYTDGVTYEGEYKEDKKTGYGLYFWTCLLYTSPSPRDGLLSRMPSSA